MDLGWNGDGMKQINNKVSQNCKYVLKNTWKHDRLMFLWVVLASIFSIIISLLGVYLPTITISGLENKWQTGRLLLFVIGFTMSLAFFNYLKAKVDANYIVIQDISRHRYINLMNKRVMDCSFAKLEKAEIQVKIEQVAQLLYTSASAKGINGMQNNLRDLLGAFIGLFMYVIILKSLSVFIIIFMLVISLGSSWLRGRMDIYIHKNRDKWAVIDKKISYINYKLTRNEFSKDIRNYNCTNWLMDKLEATIGERRKWYKKIQDKDFKTEIFKSGISILRDAVVISYIIWMVLDGQITIAEFILFWGSSTQLSSFFERVFNSYSGLRAASMDMTLIRSFLEDKDQAACDGLIQQEGEKPPIVISFEHVYFMYEGASDYIIEDFHTTISAGEKIALVGMNGAGKTTLIKLLCGFYKPTKGRILINDISIDQIKSESLTSIISAVFQDSVILPLSIAQNIALTTKEIDYKLLKECIENAGLKERLPDVNLPLIKAAQENGIELSGGELQKLYLARALYKNSQVLLLDEPTAALDPIAESNIYLKYKEFSKGKTSIFISHRLASTSFCDRILLLKDGCIYEEGSHEQLMQKQGEYFNLFQIQRQYYQEEVGATA